MACRISELALGCRDPEVLARSWCDILSFVVLDRMVDGLLELGARRADIGQPGQEEWHVLAEPEGNGFCLLEARLDLL